MGKVLGMIGIAALAAILLLGRDFSEVRLGPAFALLGVSCLSAGAILLFRVKEFRFPVVGWAMFPAAVYFIWRTLGGESAALCEADRLLVILLVFVVITVGGIRSFWKGAGDWMLLALLWLLAVGNVLVAGFQAWGDQSFMVFESGVLVDSKASGFFSHHNPFASFMAGILGYSIAGFLLLKSARWKGVAGIVIVSCMVGVALSQSRGGVLAVGGVLFVAVLGAFALKLFRKDRGTWKIAVFGVLLLSGALLFGGYFISHLEGVRGKEILGGGIRPSLFKLGTSLFMESPVSGHGPRAYSYLAAQNWTYNDHGWIPAMPQFAHNEFLQALVDYGMIGGGTILAVLVLVLIKGIVDVCQPLKRDQVGDALLIGAFAGLAGFLIQCFFSFLAHIPTTLALAAIHIGVILRWSDVSQSTKLTVLPSRLLGAIFLVGGIWFANLGYGYTKALWELREMREGGFTTEKVKLAYGVGERTKQAEYYVEGAARAVVASDRESDFERKTKWQELALEGYWKAHELNPKAPEGISGYAVVLDRQGLFGEAQKWHELAVKNAGALRWRLGYDAALGRSQFQYAVSQMAANPEEAERALRKSEKLLRKGVFINERSSVFEERKRQRQFILKWVQYLEGRRLYDEGGRLWKDRKAAKGMALMLAAEKRYRGSEKLVGDYESRWRPEWEQLQKSLRILRAGKIKPEKISKEEIEAIALGPFKDGLASGKGKR